MTAFRAVRPRARLGRYSSEEKDAEADIVFASVQTLARSAHLGRFDTRAFDYIVVDEFHHAAAATYRRIIDYFEPGFLLGLTATPDRSDGGDLLGLCEENLVYECDLWSGIDRGLLAPFHYYGVPDPVEYAQIPWRSGRFDEAALTAAVATQARAENALEQLAKRGGKKTIELWLNLGDAHFQAARFSVSLVCSIPSVNLIPSMTFGN
jgi:superfamily II DNA or RNA helicase